MSERPDILREYRVKLVPAEEAGPRPQYADDLGLRTKFGGTPDSIQVEVDEEKTCPQCFQRMHFIAQIDSFEFKGTHNPNRKDHGDAQFMFGDVGMIYVWFCFQCLTPYAATDCY